MTEDSEGARPKPPRVTGVNHFFAAAGYSGAGLRRLWAEAAFRHEGLAAVAALCLLAFVRATAAEFAGFAVLALLLVATEALNTALECIVDHLSPDWSEFARDAKDLGSLAVMCLLIANGMFLGAVVFW